MTILLEAIRGISLGVEWVEEEQVLIVDVLALRILFLFGEDDDSF